MEGKQGIGCLIDRGILFGSLHNLIDGVQLRPALSEDLMLLLLRVMLVNEFPNSDPFKIAIQDS